MRTKLTHEDVVAIFIAGLCSYSFAFVALLLINTALATYSQHHSPILWTNILLSSFLPMIGGSLGSYLTTQGITIQSLFAKLRKQT